MSLASRAPLSLLLVPLLACGPDKDPLDGLTQAASGSPTGSPTGGSDPTGGSNNTGGTSDGTGGQTETGGDPTDTSPTSSATTSETGGGGIDPACSQYLECVAVVSPDSYPEAEMSYGPNSSCWQLTPDIAQMCADACQMGLEAYGQAFPNEPACGGSGGTTTDATTTNTTQTTDATTSTTTGGSQYGNCGWNTRQQYYACDSIGGVPGVPDPDGSPIDCPEPLPALGSMCDENSPVNGIGCCLPNGDNYYCAADNTIAVDNCGA